MKTKIMFKKYILDVCIGGIIIAMTFLVTLLAVKERKEYLQKNNIVQINFFSYSHHNMSGAFNMKEVVRWYEEGEGYEKSYCVVLKNGEKIGLTPKQFRDFEEKLKNYKNFNKKTP